jgi:hypothetical protein
MTSVMDCEGAPIHDLSAMRFVPAILASLLLAAHFLRSGSYILVAASLGLSLLPLIRRPWSRLAHRVFLIAGACEWIWTSYRLVNIRMHLGEPWTRMVIILGTVALFTAAAAMLLPRSTPRPRAGT